MMRMIGMVVVVTMVAAAAAVVWFWDGAPPVITVIGPEAVGPNGSLQVQVTDTGKGLRSIQVQVIQGDKQQMIADESMPGSWLPWAKAEASRTVTISDWKQLSVGQGSFTVAVRAVDQPNLWFLSRSASLEAKRDFDAIPPRISIESREHYLRQGGSEVVQYKVDEAGTSGVRIGEDRFVGYPVPGRDDGTRVCIFALGFDRSADQAVQVFAEDLAGNRSETRIFCKTFAQRFRHRNLDVSENFIGSVTPEILSRSEGVQSSGDPLTDFLTVNRDLRVRNNEQIAVITREPSPELYWEQPFLQLTNSQVEAVFADQRSYSFKGERVDEQVHLGFDLASLAQADVEASNAGKVVFADYLGIYGNTVIVEHGLGLFSLYGHLSSIAVEKEQMVSRGQALGRTGQTGLAGGDHLHFSMIVQGVQINPVEWWDPAWVENHFRSKVR